MMSRAFPWARTARLDHVGVLVEDSVGVERLLSDAIGLKRSATERVDPFGVELRWLGGLDVPLELISPFDSESGAARRLRERGAGADHVAFRVDSVADALAWCREMGVPTLDPAPREGSRGTKIAFLDPAGTGGLRIELVEHPQGRPSR